MKQEDAQALRLLGYDPEKCAEIGHAELNRHAVFLAGDEVVKFYGAGGGVDAKARARAEQEYSALARERGVLAPATLRLGEVAGRFYTVSQRLPGSPSRDAGGEIWREAGRMLGAFHAPVLRDGGPWREKWLAHCRSCAIEALEYPLDAHDARTLASAAKWLEAEASPNRFTLLPMGACHGDFSMRNVLCEGGRALGLIDFELASDGNVELELARLSRAEFAKKPDSATAFFSGYRESAYLAPGFMSRLPLYLVGEAIFACSWTHAAVPEHFRESVDWLAGFISRF